MEKLRFLRLDEFGDDASMLIVQLEGGGAAGRFYGPAHSRGGMTAQDVANELRVLADLLERGVQERQMRK